MAFDVGRQRIGVAEAHSIARLAQPIQTLQNSQTIFDDIAQLVAQKQAIAVVAGLPRDMQGRETDQTRYTRAFVATLKPKIPAVPVYWQDEALTSHKAEQELHARHRPFAKEDVDALAASYILEDFLAHPLATGELA